LKSEIGMIKDEKIFITGGLGFIGSHLIERLVNDNKITVFDNGHRNALQALGIKSDNLEIVEGDILNKGEIRDALKDHTIIIHLAAIAGVDTVIKNPVKTFNVNFFGANNILECAKDSSVKKIINFSTSEVYGSEAENVNEEMPTIQGPISEPRWNYALSKLASEYLMKAYNVEFGVPTCSIRAFNIYGPRQVGEGGVHNFITRAINNEDLVIHNDGEQVRAWCYVEDMVNAIELMLGRDDLSGHVFNIGNPESIKNIELAKKIIDTAGSESKIRFKEIDYPDVMVRVPNVEKAKKMIGFEPKVNLDEGIKRTIEWYKQL